MYFSKQSDIISRNAHFRRRQFKQSFCCIDIDFSVFIFCTYIRLLVDYNSVIWSPDLLCDIDRIENVQRKFTKSLQGFHNTPYPGRLEFPKLESSELRRIKANLIFVYKMINNLVDCNYKDFSSLNTRETSRNNYKINTQYSRVNSRKYFFYKLSSTNMEFFNYLHCTK